MINKTMNVELPKRVDYTGMLRVFFKYDLYNEDIMKELAKYLKIIPEFDKYTANDLVKLMVYF